jgi:hypothetical protein
MLDSREPQKRKESMSIALDFTNPKIVVARVSETLHHDDANEQKKAVVEHIAKNGTFKILVILEDSFTSIDPDGDWFDNSDDEIIQENVEQIAVIGDEKWQDNAVLFFLSGALPIPIKFFKNDQQDFARAWLGDERYYATIE